MKPISSNSSINGFPFGENIKPKKQVEEAVKDSVEISNTAKVYDKIDKFLNLGDSKRLDLDGMNESERKEFLKILASLIKKGIVGYEVLDVNGKPEKHFVDNQIGDKRLKGAKLYKKKDFYVINK